MFRLVPLALLLLAAAGASARADDSTIDGRPCNNFCRTWLGLASEPPLPAPTPPRTEALLPPAADAAPATPDTTETVPIMRRRRYAARPRPHAVRFASRVERIGAEPDRLVPEPSRPERASPAPDLARIEGHGGYPSGIPVENAAVVAQAVTEPTPMQAPSAATWEQTALRIFEGADAPMAAPAMQPGTRHVRPRRR